MKSLQNKTLRCFTSTHQSDAMPRFSKALIYCAFNVHYEALIHNPGLMNRMDEIVNINYQKYLDQLGYSSKANLSYLFELRKS